MTDDQVLKFYEKISEMSERIARVETMLKERHDESIRVAELLNIHDERISKLERSNAKFFGSKEIVAWSVATGIGIVGVIF